MTDARVSAVGRRIRQLRLKMGVSQESLAALAELDRRYMGQDERGEKILRW